MKFTPTKYAVMYHGERHPVGVTFDIDPGDAEEMSVHGTVERDNFKAEQTNFARRSAGRPRKN